MPSLISNQRSSNALGANERQVYAKFSSSRSLEKWQTMEKSSGTLRHLCIVR